MQRLGEQEAFNRLLEEHFDGLYRYALRLCKGRSADAEDLVQDAVLRALKYRDQLRSLETGRGWLFQILTRTHFNRIRSWGRRAEALATDLDEAAFEEALVAWSPLAGPEEQMLRRLEREQLLAAMDRLDPAIRAALWLSDVEGFTQREVAKMLAIPEGTVSSRVFRARRTLRAQLSPASRDIGGGVPQEQAR